jgi:hypothetical protein
MSEWQPIETAPKDGTIILGLEIQSTLNPEEVVRIPIYWGGSEWILAWGQWDDGTFHIEATHWMPLPPPPQ